MVSFVISMFTADDKVLISALQANKERDVGDAGPFHKQQN